MKKIISFLFFWLAVSYGYGQIMNSALNDAFLLPKGNFQITTGNPVTECLQPEKETWH